MLTALAKLTAYTLLILPLSLFAENLRFYIVAKNKADMNFQRVLQGCNADAVSNGDECFLVGPKISAQADEQFKEIKHLLASKQIDGMAISVIDNTLVSTAIQSTSIPIITFDSPLSALDSSQAVPIHIGVDDVKVGRKLAELAMADRPQGGSVCILSDNDPNLARRLQGVRLQLSHDASSMKLVGENGWRETDECPWMTGDSPIRTRHQLNNTLETSKPDVIISVGHWPVYFPEVTEWLSKHYLAELAEGKPYLYSAIGYMVPSFSRLLENGYVYGYVEIDFFEQGRSIYRTLHNYSQGNRNLESRNSSEGLLVHHR